MKIVDIDQAFSEAHQKLIDRFEEIHALVKITSKINTGLILGDVLEFIYKEFKQFIPYDRMGLALIDNDSKWVRSFWNHAEYDPLYLKPGYTGPLEGSTLKGIAKTGKPRIINDLVDYLVNHPRSESSQLIVKEGIQSSLTCPLVSQNKAIGFIFFSSRKKDMFKDSHIEMFLQISGEISLLIQKADLYRQVVELSKFKHKFLGAAVHDLTLPLKNAQSGVQILLTEEGGELNRNQKDFLLRVQRDMSSMYNILNDFIELGGIESGHLEIRHKNTDLNRLIEETLRENIILAKSKDIDIHYKRLEPPAHIYLDPFRIKQALDNLLNNAIKYSFPNTLITVQGYWDGPEVVVSVSDQGQGVSDEDFDLLFKEFGQTHTKPTGLEGSTGLGLYIVNKIIRAHNGTVSAVKNAGPGMTFSFRLPTKHPAN